MSETDSDYFNPGGEFDPPDPEMNGTARENVIITAPDYSSFVKGTRTGNARAYEEKVRSMLKTGLFHSLHNKRLDDAAMFLHYGPNFAATAGDLADRDERAAKMIDMITAPDNPYIAFGLALVALGSQFARNHERELAVIPAAVKEGRRERKMRRAAEKENPGLKTERPRINVRLPFGRSISLAFGIRFRSFKKIGAMLRFQTRDPQELVQEVFSNEALLKALKKQGFEFVRQG